MGSPGSGAPDCTVGSIVWVRRRNGSWWPGKILSPEELDATHLTSPRSGTPVKLLGREDASVDWYNLEKSKRVKAFRCGDFDECIERVESSQGLPIRKREKYARREDAILHALELEKELLKKEGILVLERGRNKSSDATKEKLMVSGTQDIRNGKQESTGFSRPNDVDDVLLSQYEKEEDQPSCEDDHIEVAPRMRGLQDFGLRIDSSKRKAPCSNGPDTFSKPLACNNSPPSSSGDHSMERSDYALGKEHIGSAYQTKRTRYMFSPDEANDALDLHESLLNQRETVHSSFSGGDSRHYHPSLSEEDPPEFLEEEVGSESSGSDSDSSETEEDTDDDIAMLSGEAFIPPNPQYFWAAEGVGRHSAARHDAFGRHMTAEEESTSSEDHEESSFSGDSSYLYPHNPVFGNEAVSKWQLKGKRNIRNLPRRFVGKADVRYNSFEHGTYHEFKKNSIGQKSLGYSLDFNGTNDLSDGTDDNDPNGRGFGAKMVGPCDDGYPHSTRAASRCQNLFSHDMLDWDDDPWEGRLSMNRHWEEKIERFGWVFGGSQHFGGKMCSPLVDADLEVQGSYQKGLVPIVSLMSKIDGRAIIGHPIQIEVLADGSSERYLRPIDYFGGETISHDKPIALPPAWRTARRSSSRVPRLPPFSSLEADDEANDEHSLADQGRKPLFKKLSLGCFNSEANAVRKSAVRIPRPPAERRSHQKKLPKKTNASASQKTRALSSFSSELSHGIKPLRESNTNSQMMHNFSNRQVLAGPPTVACIPVKLVYSRLLEKINRPPSKVAAKAFMSSSDTRRDQS